MQMSELYRRGILLPNSEIVEQQARINNISKHSRFEVLRFSDPDFYALWHTGVLMEINQKCGTMIDDYEEVELHFEVLACAITVLENPAYKEIPNSTKRILDDLKGLMLEAIRKRRSLFFVF